MRGFVSSFHAAGLLALESNTLHGRALRVIFSPLRRLHVSGSDFGKAFWPPFRTGQDEAMLEFIRASQDQPLVVTSFRGCRKTRTSERVELRCWYTASLWPWTPRVKTVKPNDVVLNGTADPMPKNDPMVEVFYFVWCAFLVCCFGFTLDFTYAYYTAKEHRAFARLRHACEEGWQGFTREVPTIASIFGLVFFMVTAMHGRMRPRVYILDDVARAMKKERELIGRKMLDFVMASGKYHLVFISSNEGLSSCFNDSSDHMFKCEKMPRVTKSQLKETLALMSDAALSRKSSVRRRRFFATHGVALGGAVTDTEAKPVVDLPVRAGHRAGDSSQALFGSDVDLVVDKYPEHHAYSLRWWGRVSAHEYRSSLVNICKGDPPRAFLLEVTLRLDTECDEVFRANALCESAALVGVERDKLIALFSSADERQRIKEKLPKACPRRLALVWALALTCKSPPSAEDMAWLTAVVRRLVAAQPSQVDQKFASRNWQELFDTHIAPLLEQLYAVAPSLAPPPPFVWVQQCDNDSNATIGFAVMVVPASNNVDALKDAIKSKVSTGMPSNKISIYAPGSEAVKAEPLRSSAFLLRTTTEMAPYRFAVPTSL